MNALMIFVILFGALLAPAQEIQISQMKPIEGGVSASQDGIRLYLTVPSGTEVVVGDISLLADSNKLLVNGHDDPWFVRANEKGIFEVPMRIFKVLGVPEIVVGVRKPDGQIVNSKVENIAGKVTLLPGDVTLVEGQPLMISTLISGGPSEVFLQIGLNEIDLKGLPKTKSAALSGVVVTEYEEGIRLQVGDWKVTFGAFNRIGHFSDTIRVRVLKKIPLTECCPDILK